METGGGDGNETGLVTKKKGEKINDCYRCLTPDYRDKEESNRLPTTPLTRSHQLLL